MAKRTKSIIEGYLEKVSAGLLDKYQKTITEEIRGKQGIYALYRNENLYYVGLAGDLRRRVKQHLKDRHQGKWTHFSLYIIRQDDHIKELESLLLRIAYPKGNSTKGKLPDAADLKPRLQTLVKKHLKDEYDGPWHTKKSKSKAASKTTNI